ncbi:hypothetical protein P8C59_006827 [Phyllachora maydis]|nr:hypothetical protein P8C59_006827 [Phyllachora maydis]
MLCSPFPSHTDKARAVFTWCHHNIAYDVQGFFSGCIPRGQTPSETILSGKAVCEGYAKVFEAIARRAGLEVAVVTGHGKGFGFKPVAEGEAPPPPNPTGHAWNAVRIDGGAWKLVDSCWGAGHIDSNKYTKQFAPHHFYLSNEAFGQRHFPSDPRHFYRQDGRIPTWGEYVLGDTRGEPARWFGDATREGLSETNFAPRERRIRVGGGGGAVRFQFAKVCEHWTPEKNGRGKQMLLVLCVKGADGEHGEVHPLDHDGFWFWIDFPARHLGRPGQDVSVMAIDTMGGESGRGLTKEEFCRRKGYQGYSMVAIASWDLV